MGAADPVVPHPSLTIEQQKMGDSVTLLCHGRLVAETAQRLLDEVHALLPQAQTIALDLGDVQYMDSAGLGVLVGVYVSTKRAGKRLQLVKLSGRVQELLEITKLLSVFEGYGESL